MVAVACTKCQKDLPAEFLSAEGAVTCPYCRRSQTISLFPALLKEPPHRRSSSTPLFEGDSACFYDPDKKAVAICDDCGRFISDFHRVSMAPNHTTCLACLTDPQRAKSQAVTKRERTVYDNLALAMAIIPPISLVGLYFVIFTAPATLYIVIRYWKTGSNSAIPRGNGRFVFAAIIAILELLAIVFIAIAIYAAAHEEGTAS